MKKIFAYVLVLVIAFSACFVLASCVRPQTPDFVVPEGGYDGSDVTIEFYSSMGQDYNTILEETLVKFNELYPNITVNHTRGGDYDTNRKLITTMLGNGQSPNVAFCYADHVALYNRSRAIVSLDSLIESQIETTLADGTTEILGLTTEQKDDFIKTYYNEGKDFGDDKMYMLPFAKSTELMYYNKTSFEEWGLEVPDHWFATDGKQGLDTSDKTSLEYALALIKSKDPMCVPLGVDSGANWLITLFEQYETGYTSATGDHYLFDNEDNYEFLITLRRWYQNNWFTTKELLSGTYTSTY
ncbi:MAG: extracellular solute-binding protein, partial [Clostridia bacterium]|nr:extracellular solute-binding protein [Clostridia bacterium]